MVVGGPQQKEEQNILTFNRELGLTILINCSL